MYILSADVEHDGEGEASLNKTEDRDREGEEGRVSNTTHVSCSLSAHGCLGGNLGVYDWS